MNDYDLILLVHKELLDNQKNKQKIAKKTKEYRENNKQKIAEKDKVKTPCECGKMLNKSSLTRHKRKSCPLKP